MINSPYTRFDNSSIKVAGPVGLDIQAQLLRCVGKDVGCHLFAGSIGVSGDPFTVPRAVADLAKKLFGPWENH